MSVTRSVDDRLRAEYADLLPTMRRTLTAIETEVAYMLLPATLDLHRHERILVRGRVKECESAIDSLRRRQESRRFETDRADTYSLTALPDLVGVRVLTFPSRRLRDAEQVIRPRITGWTADPIPSDDPTEDPIALKYHGHWNRTDFFRSEIQIVSLLIGLFWEVEHAAIYKPSPNLRGVSRSLAMQARTADVLSALRRFEREFGKQIEISGLEFPTDDGQ